MEREWKLRLLKRALQIFEEGHEEFICTCIHKAFLSEAGPIHKASEESKEAWNSLTKFIEDAIHPWSTMRGYIYGIFIKSSNVFHEDSEGWISWIRLQRISWLKQMISAIEENRSLHPPHFTDLDLRPKRE